MIELHGRRYQRIGGVWHFYYPLKNGVEWHELLNWSIKRELKAAQQSVHWTVGILRHFRQFPRPKFYPTYWHYLPRPTASKASR